MARQEKQPYTAGDIWMMTSAIGMLTGLAVRFMVDWGVI